jgi:hypothetical protein
MGVALNIGWDVVEVLDERLVVVQADLCFPLQLTRNELRNEIRSGRLATVRAGRVKVVGISDLGGLLLERNELLAIEFLRGFGEGRFDMPRTAAPDERPPWLISRLDLLRAERPNPGKSRRASIERQCLSNPDRFVKAPQSVTQTPIRSQHERASTTQVGTFGPNDVRFQGFQPVATSHQKRNLL